MDKKKIIVLVLGIVLIMSIYMTYRTYENKPKELPEEKEKIETKKKQFAMYIKDGDKYVEYHGEDENENLFPEGYKLNIEQSRCEDIDGNKIEDISFNTNTSSITVTSNKTAYCYLYFDKQLSVNDLRAKSGVGLSSGLVGGMYRYQGADTLKGNQVRNYICLENVGFAGCSDASSSGKDDNMYRIIGITEEGNMKVIKQTKYGNTYKWWNNYTENKEWPDSLIFETLNEDYYNSLNDNIKNKIETQEWLYGDTRYQYLDEGITAEQMWKIETGKANTKYWNPTNGDSVENETWTKRTASKPIGLMYIHDYAYAESSSGHYKSCRTDHASCKSSWIHISNNGGATLWSDYSAFEWTMARVGRIDGSDPQLGSYAVDTDGHIGSFNLTAAYAVRPVFYLRSNIELGGEGTYDNPFFIAS